MSTLTAPKKREVIALNLVAAKAPELSKAFGISAKRRDEICEIIEHQVKDKKTSLAEDMAAIAAKTNNHEELSFAMFMLGVHASEAQSNPLASLAALLEHHKN